MQGGFLSLLFKGEGSAKKPRTSPRAAPPEEKKPRVKTVEIIRRGPILRARTGAAIKEAMKRRNTAQYKNRTRRRDCALAAARQKKKRKKQTK